MSIYIYIYDKGGEAAGAGPRSRAAYAVRRHRSGGKTLNIRIATATYIIYNT